MNIIFWQVFDPAVVPGWELTHSGA